MPSRGAQQQADDERAALLPTASSGETSSSSNNGPARYDGSDDGRRRPPPLAGRPGGGGQDEEAAGALEAGEAGDGEPVSMMQRAETAASSRGGDAASDFASARSHSSDFLRTLSSSISLSYGPLITRGGSSGGFTSGHSNEGGSGGGGHERRKSVGQKWQSLDVYQSLAGVTRHPTLAHEVSDRLMTVLVVVVALDMCVGGF